MYLVEIVAFNQATEAEETLYFSDIGFVSPTFDVDLTNSGAAYTVPADTAYLPRLVDGPLVDRNLYSPNTIGGRSVPSYGEINLLNGDGELDYLRSYTFDGRSVKVVWSSSVDITNTKAKLVFGGVIRDALLDEENLSVRLFDNQSILNERLAPQHSPYSRLYEFDGTSDTGITCPAAASLMGIDGWTVEAWFVADPGSDGVLWSMGDLTASGSTDKAYIRPISAEDGGNWRAYYDGNVGNGAVSGVGSRDSAPKANYNYADGKPHHIAVTLDYSDYFLRVYTDGEFAGSFGTLSGGGPSSGGTQALFLGHAETSSVKTLFFKGKMWDVRGWSYARDPEEIRRDKDSRLTGTEDRLEFWYPLDEAPPGAKIKQVFDYSTNRLDGEVNGTDQLTYGLGYGGEQVEGSQRPLGVGSVFNCQPVLLDPMSQMYMVSDTGVANPIVYDGAVPVRGQKAALLDGSSVYLNIPDSAVLDDAVVWEFMFNWNGFGAETQQDLFDFVNGNAEVDFNITGTANGTEATLNFTVSDSNSNTATITSQATIGALSNYRVTGVYDVANDYMALYLNGDLEGTAKPGFTGTVTVGTNGVYLGRDNAGTAAGYFDGLLWDVRAWSSDQIVNDHGTRRELLYSSPYDYLYKGSGLLGWWPVDEGTGTSVFDWSYNRISASISSDSWSAEVWTDLNDGRITLNGVPSKSLTCGFSGWEPVGKGTMARSTSPVYFNESTKYDPGTGDFSWEFWIRSSDFDTSANSFPISKKSGNFVGVSGYEGSWAIQISSGGILRLVMTDASSAGVASLSTAYYAPHGSDLGVWKHIAATWDASKQIIQWYVDGSPANTSNLSTLTASYDFTSSETLTLFARNTSGSSPFLGGSLCQVRFWSDLRSAEEIKSNYWRTGARIMQLGAAENLVFYWTGSENIPSKGLGASDDTFDRSPETFEGVLTWSGTVFAKEQMRLVPGPGPRTTAGHIRALVASITDQSSDSIDGDSFDLYDIEENNAVTGWYFSDGVLSDAIDELVKPIGFWRYEENIYLGRLLAPDIANILTFDATNTGRIVKYNDIDEENAAVAFWLKWDGSSRGWLVYKSGSFYIQTHSFIGLATPAITIGSYQNNTDAAFNQYSFDPEPGVSYYIVAFFNPNALYIDGVQKTSSQDGTSSGSYPYGDMYIGGKDDGTNLASGSIWHLQVWDRGAVDAGELYDLRYTELSGSEAGLLGYWPLTSRNVNNSIFAKSAVSLSSGYSWDPVLLYDNPFYSEPAVTYEKSDEVSISRTGNILPVTEQQVRYLKNFSRVPREQALVSEYWNADLLRLFDSDGPSITQKSRYALSRHLLPTKDNPIAESPYRDLEAAKLAARLRVFSHGVQRERYRVEVWDENFSLSVGDTIRLKDTRFDFPDNGKNFIVMGISEKQDIFHYELDVWG